MMAAMLSLHGPHGAVRGRPNRLHRSQARTIGESTQKGKLKWKL